MFTPKHGTIFNLIKTLRIANGNEKTEKESTESVGICEWIRCGNNKIFCRIIQRRYNSWKSSFGRSLTIWPVPLKLDQLNCFVYIFSISSNEHWAFSLWAFFNANRINYWPKWNWIHNRLCVRFGPMRSRSSNFDSVESNQKYANETN